MRKDVWIFLLFLGLVLFNWPLLDIAGKLSGPSLPLYLFGAWAVFIVLMLVVSRRASGREEP